MGLSTTIKQAANKLSRQPKPNSQSKLLSEIPCSQKRRKSSLSGVVGQGRYRVDKIIGAGAAGVVYAAWHTQLKKPIALKVLRDELCRDQSLVERFLNEARTASSIDEAHVVDVMDCGLLDDGRPYFVMERLEGMSLADLLDREDHLNLESSLSIAIQIAQGLAAAHARGVIHRDLKPDNIFVCRHAQPPYFIKLLDFGIAKLLDSGVDLTRAGHIFGTPHYMSPEQTLGVAIDQRSDIYAFGVVLYELLSGRVPIDGSHPVEVLQRHRDGHVVPLRSHPACASVPPRLEALVHRCLEKDPQRRYASMQEVLDDLRRLWERFEDRQSPLDWQPEPVSARLRRRSDPDGSASHAGARRIGHAVLTTPQPVTPAQGEHPSPDSALFTHAPDGEPALLDHRHEPTRDSYRVRARQRLRSFAAAVCLGTLGGFVAAVAVRVVLMQ